MYNLLPNPVSRDFSPIILLRICAVTCACIYGYESEQVIWKSSTILQTISKRIIIVCDIETHKRLISVQILDYISDLFFDMTKPYKIN